MPSRGAKETQPQQKKARARDDEQHTQSQHERKVGHDCEGQERQEEELGQESEDFGRTYSGCDRWAGSIVECDKTPTERIRHEVTVAKFPEVLDLGREGRSVSRSGNKARAPTAGIRRSGREGIVGRWGSRSRIRRSNVAIGV
jgi:hypothetical protein